MKAFLTVHEKYVLQDVLLRSINKATTAEEREVIEKTIHGISNTGDFKEKSIHFSLFNKNISIIVKSKKTKQ